ncbi:MAG: hypothetical protein K2M04_04215 [Muribaculaceae bacterium]|nr:hypothetical protein [Muribaculaceae bacterium]
MTLQEFFLSVDFESIWTVLTRLAPCSSEYGVSFKQTYDNICMLSPEPDEYNKIIEVSRDERGQISGINYDDHRHSVVAGRQVSVDDRLALSPEVLAVYLLWELTTWGFNDEDVRENFEEILSNSPKAPDNKYWDEYHEKHLRWFPPIPFKNIHKRMRAKNRSKRKRDYRHKKRLQQLRRFAKIEELQQYLIRHNIDFNLWNVLARCKSFSLTTDHSYTANPADAALYLCDLYSKYCDNRCDLNDIGFTIIIITGGNKALEDFPKLYDVLKNTYTYPYILVGDSEDNQITVKIISVSVDKPKFHKA